MLYAVFPLVLKGLAQQAREENTGESELRQPGSCHEACKLHKHSNVCNWGRSLRQDLHRLFASDAWNLRVWQ